MSATIPVFGLKESEAEKMLSKFRMVFEIIFWMMQTNNSCAKLKDLNQMIKYFHTAVDILMV